MTTVVCDLAARDAGATLVDAFSTQGFAALVGHGVPDDVIEHMRAVSLEFFDLPREEKARCEWVGHDVWRGWQPVFEGGERFADDSTVEWREWLEENLCRRPAVPTTRRTIGPGFRSRCARRGRHTTRRCSGSRRR